MSFTYQKFIAITLSSLLLVVVGPFEVAALGALQPRSSGERGVPSRAELDDSDDVLEAVEDAFGDDHVMVDVARCESSFRQFNSSGDVLVNSIGATGVFQILQRVHEDIAEDFGYDIYTTEGNIDYAMELYEADGLKPWSASSLCWDDGTIEESNPETATDERSRSGKLRRRVEHRRAELEIAKESSSDGDAEEVISKRLIIGVDDPEVKRLQELLGELGHRLARSGPGSPGEETSFFGLLTKAALQEFQCDQGIICSGSEYTTGYGMADSSTRAALNKAAEEDRVSQRVERRSPEDADSQANSDLAAQIAEIKAMIAKLQAQIQ